MRLWPSVSHKGLVGFGEETSSASNRRPDTFVETFIEKICSDEVHNWYFVLSLSFYILIISSKWISQQRLILVVLCSGFKTMFICFSSQTFDQSSKWWCLTNLFFFLHTVKDQTHASSYSFHEFLLIKCHEDETCDAEIKGGCQTKAQTYSFTVVTLHFTVSLFHAVFF